MRKLLLASLLLLTAACASPTQGGTAAAPDNGGAEDAVDDVGSGGDSKVLFDTQADTLAADAAKTDGQAKDGAADATAASFVWLTFEVDDSANKTFGDGDMRWTGSFTWDSASNTITYATSWMPTDGPFAPLYDDGPLSKGGHEREGATAADHIFSTAVKFATTADTTIEYGALNELDHWMWLGPNGKLVLKKGATGVVEVPGMALKKFGTADVKLVLDTKALAASFSTWSISNNKFFAKGSMNQWTPVQLLDDGKKGDEAAGDGKLTFVLKQNLGIHDGPVSVGDEVQFIFVATTGDALPEDGQEYKGATAALQEGVAAWTDAGTGWISAPVVLAKDSKGKFLNTAIVVPAATTGCNPTCSSDQTCVGSTCMANFAVDSLTPPSGPAAGGTPLTIKGAGIAAGATVTLDGMACTPVTVSADAKTLGCKTPTHAPGKVDVTVTNPGDQVKTLKAAFTYDDYPAATLILSGDLAPVSTDAVSFAGLSALAKVPAYSQLPGQTAGLSVEFGWGPFGTDPTQDKTWQWVAGTYAGDDALGKGEENFTGAFAVLSAGKYSFTARVTWQGTLTYGDADGSENGISVAKLGTLTVVPKPAGVPTLTGISPGWAAAKGGSTIVLLGENLLPAFPISFVSTNSAKTTKAGSGAQTVAGQGISVVVPSLVPLPADVSIAPVSGPALTLAAALEMVPFDTPTVDGNVGMDWNPFSVLAMNNIASSWGPGMNDVGTVFASFDKDNVYIGVVANCEAANAIVVYIDPNYDGAADTLTFTDLVDNTGSIDDAISSVLVSTDPNFGPHFAFASIGMQSFGGGDLALSTGAGLRGLDTPTNFAWLDAKISANAAADMPGIEASLPLSTLYPNGVPKTGATLAYVVVLLNKDGTVISNQVMPFQAGAPAKDPITGDSTLTTFAKLRVFPAPAVP